MRAPIQPHVRADHSGGGADYARAKIDHDQSVGEVVNADRHLMVAIAIGAMDLKIAHAVSAHIVVRHRRAAIGQLRNQLPMLTFSFWDTEGCTGVNETKRNNSQHSIAKYCIFLQGVLMQIEADCSVLQGFAETGRRIGAATVALWMALTGLDRHPSGPCVSPVWSLCSR